MARGGVRRDEDLHLLSAPRPRLGAAAGGLPAQCGEIIYVDEGGFGSSVDDWIRRCDVFVYPLSKTSLESGFSKSQLEYAVALGLPILPVRISEIDPTLIDPAVAPRIIDYAPPKAARGDALMHALQVLASQRRPLTLPFPPPPSEPGKEFLAGHHREQLRSNERFFRKQAQKRLDELLPPAERWANSLATSAVLANWARELAMRAPAPQPPARPYPRAEHRAPAAGTTPAVRCRAFSSVTGGTIRSISPGACTNGC